ncbi:MAG: hypothetical protein HY762_01975 [Planctomycetes bacterium]|nr:hypothetical protein [Planctomycetota bacterium]
MQRTKLTVYQQRVLLVGVGLSSGNSSGNNSLDELASLVDTIGAKVVDRITQQRTKPDMTRTGRRHHI